MRISDWSSDVCSSDLFAMARAHFYAGDCAAGEAMGDAALRLNAYDPDITGFMGLFKAACGHGAAALPLLQRSLDLDASYAGVPAVTLAFMLAQNGEVARALAILDRMPSPRNQIGRATCRERVCQYVSISVVAVSLKKKYHTLP